MHRTVLHEAALANRRLHQLPVLPGVQHTAGRLAATTAEFEALLDDFVVAFDPVISRVLQNIDEHGLHITGVFPTSDTAPEDREQFSYTTGLSERLGFELALATMPYETALWILNTAATLLKDTPAEGDRIEGVLGGGYTARLHRCADTSRFAMTRRIYGSDPDRGVWQVLVPDAAGLFPDEPGYNHTGLPQPLY
ncbi:DUF4262 domain-containing protein [Streptacidiphilus jiangxiensis]|uniref:Uncharacterized protein n=1 Tax=Streptacidiphilus jiangxiensis TaxID=235985 RepID=A0A1H8B4V0_STRJI|nr:DUF4262 domain-containing protein [Streptacidiphilus jiangxiensis]SEM77965.1 protein of unknown function [Streptacidiphilus jiangxiensis]